MSGGERGFTLIAMLLAVAVTGAGLAAYAQSASHAARREKEAELLFIGNQYRQAIASYYRKEQRYPRSLDELLKDPRYPMAVRHLRKRYRDPLTGAADWLPIEAPGGGIMGVHSRSEQIAIKTGNFAARDASLAAALRDAHGPARYIDWQFFYRPENQGRLPISGKGGDQAAENR